MVVKEPVAIVGMSGRFPKAKNLKEFWELLKNGVNTISELPGERFKMERFYDPDPSTPNKSYQKYGSFLEFINDFDPFLFNISPAEAIEMSPSQKLLLELTWEAIEESNIPFDEITGKKVGVYVGNIWSDFEHYRKHKNANTTSHSAVGQSANIIANRVSYTFGFSGPSLVVDTGCSSSLVALHLACQSLWDGGSEMGVVAGINHILDHDQYVLLSKFGGLSKKGQCSAFSNEADGFVRGEGAGLLIIKKLSDAEKNGDHILAVIRGTSMNNNGYNVNLPATSIKGQLEMLHEAYKDSGLDPAEIHYVEAHGTGTRVGDPTETKAIGQFFSKGRDERNRLRIGSVKTNIGHLEGAAGMAGLLKVLLAMQHRELPKSLHFTTPNPEIPFDELKLKVNDQHTPWTIKEGETLKAGVNSFGWGGTNAHAVLEEYIRKDHIEHIDHKNEHLLCLSAKTDGALTEYVKRYRYHLSEKINGSKKHLDNIIIGSAIRKPNLEYRYSFVGKNKEDLIQKFDHFLADKPSVLPVSIHPEDKVVFVFPGQGSQWLGMGREMYEKEPVFKKSIDDCEEAFSSFADWSLKEQLFADESLSRLNEIDVIQPSLFAIQIAIAKVWMSKGIIPDAVVGHSMGEVASAYISGSISLYDAANIICSRSKLMKTVSGTGGAMAVTELSIPQAEEIIANYPGKLSVAVSNSPKSTVIAGNETELLEVLSQLEKQDLFCRQVKVDVASHSPQMDTLMEPLREQVKGMQPKKSEIPFFSTVKNELVEGDQLNEDYWVSNLRGMVQFSDVMKGLLTTNHRIFIEMSPHPVLTNAVNECSEAFELAAVTIPSLFREKPEMESFLGNVGKLVEKGFEINWKKFYGVERVPMIELPSYPMQKQTYELEDRSEQTFSALINGNNPLLGRRIQLAGINNSFIWENKLSLEHLSFVKDHKVNNAAVLPGVSYLEMIHAALQDAFGNAFHQVEELRFKTPIYLQENEIIDTQLKIERHDQHKASFTYFIKSSAATNDDWVVSAEGELVICDSRQKISDDFIYSLNRTENDQLIHREEFYQVTDGIGIQYGNMFQGIDWIRINKRQAIAHVVPNSLIAMNDHKYFIHPAILDSCFQTIFSTISNLNSQPKNVTTFLSKLKGFKWHHKPEKDDDILVKAELIDTIELPNGITKKQVAISIFDENGNFLAELDMLEAVIIDNEKLAETSNGEWLYKVQWEESAIFNIENMAPSKNWVIFEDYLGVEKKLRRVFDEHDQNLIKVSSGEEFFKIDDNQYVANFGDPSSLKEIFDDLDKNYVMVDGIIHAASLNDHIDYENLDSNDLDRIQKEGSLLLLNLHKALSEKVFDKYPKLIVLTNGLIQVKNKSPYLNISQAPMWGLAKVLFNEQPSYQCTRVDLSYFPDAPEIVNLYRAIMSNNETDPEIVLREDKTYVSRLVSEAMPAINLDRVTFSSDYTVLVTGFRGAAFPLIEWMISRGAKHFALLSRSGKANEAVFEKIAAYNDQGVNMRVYAADVANYYQLQTAFEQIRDEMPPLKNIVHAAGVIQANKVSDVTAEEFLSILRPKMEGTWNLHKLSRNLDLDAFLLFSSASTLIGLSGQGSYVSANMFVDQFAHYRRKMGLPATSINWGVIKNVGMVADDDELLRYAEAEGFIPFNIEDGVAILEKIYAASHPQIGITRLDPEVTAEYYSSLAKTKYLSRLIEQKDDNAFYSTLLDILSMNKDDAIPNIEKSIIEKVAAITKASVSIINNTMTFKGLGIDSLMAIQLRNQLEKSFGVKLAVNNFWKHPSIHQFAAFLYKTVVDNPSCEEKKEEETGWFVPGNENKNAKFRLFCFHDAGGSSSLFQDWSESISDEIELNIVELPGRGHRSKLKPIVDMQLLVGELATQFQKNDDGRPFLVFGHSMGGAVGFEVMRELRRRGARLPMLVITSSTPALFSYDRRAVSNEISEEELIERFPHLSKNAITDETIRQSYIGVMRSDLSLLDSYHYVSEEPFQVPIISLRGVDDPGVSLDQVQAWERETTLAHRVIERPGAHRYIVDDVPFVTELIGNYLTEEKVNISN